MGSDGKRGPKPYDQHQVSTIFLRVPAEDWPAVKRGHKREFRGAPGQVSGLHHVEPPTPVVAYSWRPVAGHEAELMVLEETWKEPLGAISPESLKAEGFESLAQFRRYWMKRTRRQFRPAALITCYRVRPWEPDDERRFGASIMERLYGAFLPATEAA